jgi:hypothetical protein
VIHLQRAPQEAPKITAPASSRVFPVGFMTRSLVGDPSATVGDLEAREKRGDEQRGADE